MSEKEALEQLDSLIEAWDLKDADINQTDINAIKFILQKNQKLKEQLKQRDEVIEKLEKWLNQEWKKPLAKIYVSDVVKELNKLKGENNG